jgi:hypothetical protein
VDRVRSGLLEPAADLHGRVERVSVLEPEQERVGVLADADLHLEVEVVANPLANDPHGVDEKARPVLERASVLVLALVDRGREELGERIPVGAGDQRAKGVGFPCPARELLLPVLEVGHM